MNGLERMLDLKRRGACHDVPTEVFFPGDDHGSIGPALQICAECGIREECLEYAIEFGEHGVWGGTSERERRRMSRRRRDAAYKAKKGAA